MSRDAKIELDWADGLKVFRLGWGEIIQLQEACDAGPYVVLQRLITGGWKVQDISSVIRLGLVGGGLEPAKALKLVRDYVESRPPMENTMLASAILNAGLMGAPDELPGEESGETASGSTDSPTERSE